MRKHWLIGGLSALVLLAVVLLTTTKSFRFWWQEKTAPRFEYVPYCTKFYLYKYKDIVNESSFSIPEKVATKRDLLYYQERYIARYEFVREQMMRKLYDTQYHTMDKSNDGLSGIRKAEKMATWQANLRYQELEMANLIAIRDRTATELHMKY